MDGTASILILISGMAHAVVNAIFKSGKDKMSGRALIDGFSALLVAPAAFFVPLPSHAWLWLAASWLLHLLYLFALIKSFEQADMTVAYPIARGLAPVLAAGVAVALFHEPITIAVILGILLIAAGVICIGVSHSVEQERIALGHVDGDLHRGLHGGRCAGRARCS